jgi:PAS domain S-box-containing protein
VTQGEEELRLILDFTPAMIRSARPDGQVDFVNRRWCDYAGLPLEDLRGWGWTRVLHPDDVAQWIAAWRAALADGRPFETEGRVRRADGEYRRFLHRDIPLRDVRGEIVRWYGLSIDIEDLKRAQAELRRSEAYLAEAQRLSRTGSFGWNVSSGELVWSKETFCILGYDRSMKPSLDRVLQRVHPEDRSILREALDRAAREPGDIDVVHRLLMPDGIIKHVHIVAHATGTGPEAAEFVGAVMDITEQRRSEDETRAAKARFEGILAIAEDAIISIDADERIMLFNQGAEAAFGYSRAEIIGQPLNMLIPQRLSAAHSKHLQEFARSPDIARAMGQRTSVVGRRKDGSEFPAEASISKLDVDGKLIFTVILRDITERQQAGEALRASEHLARGQLDALMHTLDALARESDPDRLLEHVLSTIIEQSDAHSVCVWGWDDEGGTLELRAAIASGDTRLSRDTNHPAQRLPAVLARHPVWGELLRAGVHGLLDGLDKPAARLCVGCGAEATCSHVLDDEGGDPAVLSLKERLRGMAVRAILFMPMTMAGNVTGIIGVCFNHQPSLRHEDVELTRALAQQTMLVIHVVGMSQQSRRMAVTAERNRMAREIHDTLAQGFTGVIVQLEAAADARARGLLEESEEHLARAGNLARESLQEARRSVHALRPRRLEQGNLCEALRRLMSEMTAGTSIVAELTLEGEPRTIPGSWEENILRIGQEALTNALRHARANHVSVRISFSDTLLGLRVCDDGSGFDPNRVCDGFGLVGMHERVKEMGGELNVVSTVGAGTEITVTLPMADATATGA